MVAVRALTYGPWRPTRKLDYSAPPLEHFSMRAITLLLLAAGCSCGRGESTGAETRRERDSVIGASQLPGAAGVRGALRASDTGEARSARVDSIAGAK